MAANYDSQFRPLSYDEVGVNDALSIRYLYDQVNNLQNWIQHVGNYPVISEMVYPIVDTNVATNAEFVYIPPFAPRIIPRCYTAAKWCIRHRTLTDGSVYYRLYAMPGLYASTRNPFDSDAISTWRESTITSSSNDWNVTWGTIYLPDEVRDKNRQVYFLLTCQNDTNEHCGEISSLTVYPYVV